MSGMENATILTFMPVLLKGFLVTLKLALEAVLLSTVAGGAIGLLLTSKIKPLKTFFVGYVYVFRGLPLLLQLFMVYYGLPYLGVEISTEVTVLVVFTLYGGAYIAEIIRGSIEAIPRGQWEAAQCLGMSYLSIVRQVILPQAMKIALPPLVGFYIGMIKDTSIASVIGCVDVLRSGRRVINVISQPFTVYAMVALLFFVICYPLSKLVDKLERRSQT